MYNQLPRSLSYKQLFQYFRRHNIAVIHLVRANVVRHLISRGNHKLDMAQLGHKQDPHPRNVTPFRRINLTIKVLHITRLLTQVTEARTALLKDLPGLHFEVVYESLAHSDLQCRAMFAFLHPKLASLPCNDVDGANAIKKQHAGRTCEQWVTNWKHVKDAVSEFTDDHRLYRNVGVYFIEDCRRTDY